MPSSGKTSLGLNQWSGSDKPRRTDFNSDNLIIDTAIVDLNKIGELVSFQPTLLTGDNNQDFAYNTRSGYYALWGGMCTYSFFLGISNIQTSTATGNIVLQMPITATRTIFSTPISFWAVNSSNIVNVNLYANGSIGFTDQYGNAGLLSMSDINTSLSPAFELRGQITYAWR